MPTTTKKKSTAAATRTYILEQTDGKRRLLTVPDTAKVTFASLNPAAKERNYGERAVLRIYEGTKQTACLQNIANFVDASYPFLVEQVLTEEREETIDGRPRVRSVEVGREFVKYLDAAYVRTDDDDDF